MPTPPNKRAAHNPEQLSQGEGNLKSPVKEGEVVEVDSAKAKARVEFGDQESADGSKFKSPFYRVMQPGSLQAQGYWLPKVGEQVVVLFLDANQEDGIIVGSTYNEQDTPPKADNNIYHYKFPDGTTVEHDANNQTITLDIKSQLVIKVGENMTVDCSSESTINGKAIAVIGAKDDDTESNGNNSITDSNQL